MVQCVTESGGTVYMFVFRQFLVEICSVKVPKKSNVQPLYSFTHVGLRGDVNTDGRKRNSRVD